MIRVAVVDDHPLFRSGVIQTLQAEQELEVVGQGATVEEAIRLGRQLRPDVLVLDMNLPERCDGIHVVDSIAADAPAVRILMLTVVADREIIHDAMKRGARGYVLKGIGGAEFIQAVRAVHRGQGYVTPTLAACLFGASDADVPPLGGAAKLGLSAREDQILAFIAKGLSNKEIGLRLELSDKTVKHYVTNLFQKLHVRNRTEAAIIASHVEWERRQRVASDACAAMPSAGPACPGPAKSWPSSAVTTANASPIRRSKIAAVEEPYGAP